jgi:hypothetical protein
MSASRERQLGRAERLHAASRPVRCFWQDEDETFDQVQARISAMIASGKARRDDRFVVFSWLPSTGERADS